MTKTIRIADVTTLPAGYRFGAHIDGDTHWVIRSEDDAAIRVELRPDYEMDTDAIREAIDEAMPTLITREDITALRTEASEAGDEDQAALCTAALAGDSDAWDACRRAIDAARAMA